MPEFTLVEWTGVSAPYGDKDAHASDKRENPLHSAAATTRTTRLAVGDTAAAGRTRITSLAWHGALEEL